MSVPPIRGEVKNGITYENNGRWLPRRLDHFIVVSRVVENNNKVVRDDVHDRLGSKKLNRIPIRLLSDDPQENLTTTRTLFLNGGDLYCVAPYHDDGNTIEVPVDESGAPITRGDVVEGARTTPFIVANRRFRGREFPVEPFEYPCSPFCRMWQEDNPKKQCKLQSILYFNIDLEECGGELFVWRAKGVWQQRTLSSSLSMVHSLTGGILANLPLDLVYHEEKKQRANGDWITAPMPTVEIRGTHTEFFKALDAELERRHRHKQVTGGSAHIGGVLKELTSRASIEELISSDDFSDADVAEDEPDAIKPVSVPRELDALFHRAGYGKRKIEMVMEQYDGDIEAIEAHVHRDIERSPDIPEKHEEAEDDFGDIDFDDLNL
jgi:hypothetical protein